MFDFDDEELKEQAATDAPLDNTSVTTEAKSAPATQHPTFSAGNQSHGKTKPSPWTLYHHRTHQSARQSTQTYQQQQKRQRTQSWTGPIAQGATVTKGFGPGSTKATLVSTHSTPPSSPGK